MAILSPNFRSMKHFYWPIFYFHFIIIISNRLKMFINLIKAIRLIIKKSLYDFQAINFLFAFTIMSFKSIVSWKNSNFAD